MLKSLFSKVATLFKRLQHGFFFANIAEFLRIAIFLVAALM